MSSITLYQAKKRRSTPTQKEYKEFFQWAHWAALEHCTLAFHGELKRDGRTERILKLLKDRDEIRAIPHGKRLIYCAKRKNQKPGDLQKPRIEHGLRSTAGLIRLYRADTTGKMVPEKAYRRQKQVPEGGISYPHGTTLLFEYCSKGNVEQRLKQKIRGYEWMALPKTTILFVLDVTREKAEHLVKLHKPDDNQYFVDYQTFMNLPMGQALTSPIYFWWTGERVEARALR